MTDENLLDEVRRFEALEIDAASFRHEDHVRIAFAMLGQDNFLTALNRYACALAALTERAGQASKFNLTVTIGFMSLVAEHMNASDNESWTAFIARNPGLLDKAILTRWWTAENLSSDAARRRFVLPQPAFATPPGA